MIQAHLLWIELRLVEMKWKTLLQLKWHKICYWVDRHRDEAIVAAMFILMIVYYSVLIARAA